MAWQLLSKAKVLKCDETGKIGIQTGPGERVVEIPQQHKLIYSQVDEVYLDGENITISASSSGVMITEDGMRKLIEYIRTGSVSAIINFDNTPRTALLYCDIPASGSISVFLQYMRYNATDYTTEAYSFKVYSDLTKSDLVRV